MLTQIGAKPESDFSEPLDMLSDCRKRIQYFLDDLVRLAEDAMQLDPAQRVALERALRYFRESARRGIPPTKRIFVSASASDE